MMLAQLYIEHFLRVVFESCARETAETLQRQCKSNELWRITRTNTKMAYKTNVLYCRNRN